MAQMRVRFGSVLLAALALLPGKVHSQYWVEMGVRKALMERIDVDINSQIRLRLGLSGLYRYRTEVGPLFHLEDRIRVGVYLENKEEWVEVEWQGLNRIGLQGEFSGDFAVLRVMDRNRLDCEGLKAWRYRNLLSIVGKPYVIAEKTGYYGEAGLIYRVAPCLEDEVFFSVTDNVIEENHLFLGALFQIVPFATLKLGCLLYTGREGDTWQNEAVIMTSLQLTFLQLE